MQNTNFCYSNFFQPFFAFEFQGKYDVEDGWRIYDPIVEYKRQVSSLLTW